MDSQSLPPSSSHHRARAVGGACAVGRAWRVRSWGSWPGSHHKLGNDCVLPDRVVKKQPVPLDALGGREVRVVHHSKESFPPIHGVPLVFWVQRVGLGTSVLQFLAHLTSPLSFVAPAASLRSLSFAFFFVTQISSQQSCFPKTSSLLPMQDSEHYVTTFLSTGLPRLCSFIQLTFKMCSLSAFTKLSFKALALNGLKYKIKTFVSVLFHAPYSSRLLKPIVSFGQEE